MNTNLGECSQDDLLLEIEKREEQNAKKNNQDWYFITKKVPNELETIFCIVHKKYWHLNHSLDDSYIRNSITLPDDFFEIGDSAFTYDGKIENAEILLRKYGFSQIDEFMYYDASVKYTPDTNNYQLQLELMCDTPDIKNLVQDWIRNTLPTESENLPFDWNLLNYISHINDFTKKHDLTQIVISDSNDTSKGIWQGAKVAILSQKIAEYLPKEYNI